MSFNFSDHLNQFLRSLSIQGSWNFPRMQGLGFFYSLLPWLSVSGNIELAVGMKAWNKLPDDLQSLLKEVVRGWKVDFYVTQKQVNYKSLKAMTDAGLEIVNLPEKDIEELNKIVEDTVTKFASRDPLSKKLWASQKKFLSAMGRRK